MMIDIHSHLDYPELLNRIDEIVENAKKAGVKKIITNGIDPISNRKCLELSERFDMIECGLGAYPRDSLKKDVEQGILKAVYDFDIDEEIEFMIKNKDKIIAISEVGLDFVEGESISQISDFEKMLSLAEKLHKPIVIHSRKAELKCVEMLESSKLKKIVMHCFSGKKSLVKRIRDNGWYFSVPTNVVRSPQFQILVEEVPITQLFCETDSPFLSPFKKKINEPAFVVESYKKIAEIKKMDFLEVVNNIFMNWQNMFG